MPNRNFSASSYRYGFNGKENDPETVGTSGGTQDYGMRIYNPALGKFLSVDPLSKDYAYYTPYQFAGNKPIAAIDLDGLEDVYITTKKDRSETMQIVYTDIHIRAMTTKGATSIPMKVYYNGDTKGTTQFEGPNRQNERAIFAVHSFTLNGAVCV